MPIDILSSLNTGGSGLNITDLTETLTAAEIDPRKSLINDRIDAAELRVSGYERLRTQAETLSEALTLMQGLSPRTLASDTSAVAVSLTDAQALDMQDATLAVDSLAQAQVLKYEGYAAADTPIGAGTLTVSFGRWSDETPSVFTEGDTAATTLRFTEDSTLSDLAEALSGVEGVSARVIDVGDGSFALGVIAEPGAANALRFSVAAGASDALAAFDFSNGPETVQVQAGQDAHLRLNGIAVTRPTNVIDDLLPGVTLTLTATTSTPATLRATPNTEGALAVMQSFVEMVNATKSLVESLTARGYGSGTTAGELAGDSLADTIMQGMEALLGQGYGTGGVHLADLGILTERDGTLTLNEAVFTDALTENPALLDPLILDDLGSTADVELIATGSYIPSGGGFTLIRNPETGAALLDGVPLFGTMQDDGRWVYGVTSGPMSGVRIFAGPDVEIATLTAAPSLTSSLMTYLGDVLASDAALAQREAAEQDGLAADADALAALDRRAEDVRARYLARFTEMERVVTQLNSTGDYLTNLIDAWNSSD